MGNEALNGISTEASVAAVKGENTGGNGSGTSGISGNTFVGVSGDSQHGPGVRGTSVDNVGVAAESQNADGMSAITHSGDHAAITGFNDANGVGVRGRALGNAGVFGESDTSRGVMGTSNMFIGVSGESQHGPGVHGKSVDNVGVAAESQNADGMSAITHSSDHAAITGFNDANGVGVRGRALGNAGVFGESDTSRGVMGTSNTHIGVSGESQRGPGVRGTSVEGPGAEGFSKSNDGVFGLSDTGVGLHGKGGRLAGFFEGDVEVTGDIRLTNADCAEDFDVSGPDKVEPGTVMILGNEGTISESQQAYDKRVAGVISGAGHYKPGIVLDKQQTTGNRQPIALMGKVFCKVDAQYGAVEVGDLLTTSPTPGHAMKTSDPLKAFGAVIGKALRPLNDGQGLIPILIALQ